MEDSPSDVWDVSNCVFFLLFIAAKQRNLTKISDVRIKISDNQIDVVTIEENKVLDLKN